MGVVNMNGLIIEPIFTVQNVHPIHPLAETISEKSHSGCFYIIRELRFFHFRPTSDEPIPNFSAILLNPSDYQFIRTYHNTLHHDVDNLQICF